MSILHLFALTCLGHLLFQIYLYKSLNNKISIKEYRRQRFLEKKIKFNDFYMNNTENDKLNIINVFQ